LLTRPQLACFWSCRSRYGDFIVADFGVDEFINKARKHPAVCAELGLKIS
jgi:hypothetical protein